MSGDGDERTHNPLIMLSANDRVSLAAPGGG